MWAGGTHGKGTNSAHLRGLVELPREAKVGDLQTIRLENLKIQEVERLDFQSSKEEKKKKKEEKKRKKKEGRKLTKMFPLFKSR